MKISVIIPSYKPKDYLWECLNSLQNQTFPKEEFEIILVLNGCTEPYKSEIKQYIVDKLQGININFIHTEIGGVSNARNIGLDNMCGEYVTFIDDDDVVSINYLENLYNVSSPFCIGCANSYGFIKDIFENRNNFVTKGFNKCYKRTYSLFRYRSFLSAPWAKLIHMNIIREKRFPLGLNKSEDSLFCMLISPNICNMKLATADTVYYQRERNGSAMRSKESVIKILKEHFYIAWMYIHEWCKHPFNYNFIFVLSRIVACGKNCIIYIKRNI